MRGHVGGVGVLGCWGVGGLGGWDAGVQGGWGAREFGVEEALGNLKF